MINLSNEMNRLSNIDTGMTKTAFSTTKEGVGAVASGLSALGMTNDSSMKALMTINGGLQIMTGMAGMATVAKTMQEKKRTEAAVKSAALVSMHTALGPYGWAKIALAAGVMAATSITMYALVSQIRLGSFDLDTPSGRADAVNAVQGAV